ncbi:MAG: DUF2254 domain-containing protein [Proteobacteria bacterium]|nr:MAG: DUF2254 domain-containing protein [Pseudomonadota bacterium]
MKTRLQSWLEGLGDIFWLRPAAVVLAGVLLGEGAVWAEHIGLTGTLTATGWIYAGGESGARALLGAVASSTISVAGTVFSITIAALSLASGQMGPRLLRNFTRDAGNQYALGIFLGTFAYALVLLRTVRSFEETPFVPHLGVTGALGLALVCVGTLVWFVHHVANGINVETVIGLVHGELLEAVRSLDDKKSDEPQAASHEAVVEPGVGTKVCYGRSGYLRSLDDASLADWAAENRVHLRMRVRPGAYLYPGAVVADLVDDEGNAGQADAKCSGAEEAFAEAAVIGERQAAAQDLEFAVRQLVEVGVRAMSPGVNDPFTAIAVMERLGASLCAVAGKQFPDAMVERDGRPVLVRRVTDYEGLCDASFHMIRQNSASSAAVLIRCRRIGGSRGASCIDIAVRRPEVAAIDIERLCSPAENRGTAT